MRSVLRDRRTLAARWLPRVDDTRTWGPADVVAWVFILGAVALFLGPSLLVALVGR